MRRFAATVALACLSALALVACGGGDAECTDPYAECWGYAHCTDDADDNTCTVHPY